MQEPNQKNPELKWWKSSALLHNVKHIQKATSSAKLSCASPSQGKSDFKSFFPPPKKRGKLWSEIFQRVILTKKAAFLLIVFAILFHTCIGKAKRNYQHYLSNQNYCGWSEGPPSSEVQYKWYHRRLCPSGKWCSSLKRIFVLKTSK